MSELPALQRPGLRCWEPPGLCPDARLALFHACLGEERKESKRHAAVPELGPQKFKPSHRLLQAGRASWKVISEVLAQPPQQPRD